MGGHGGDEERARAARRDATTVWGWSMMAQLPAAVRSVSSGEGGVEGRQKGIIK